MDNKLPRDCVGTCYMIKLSIMLGKQANVFAICVV